MVSFAAGEPDFPTPEHIVEAARRRRPRSQEPPVHARRRPPRAARGDRRQDPARQRARGRPVADHRDQRRQAGRLSRRSRRCSTRATRCCCPTPYWTTYPEAIKLAGGVPVEVFAGRRPGLPGDGRAARGGAHPAQQGAALRVARRTRPARCAPPEQTAAIAEWAEAHGLWVIADEIYQNLTYDGAARRVDRRGRARARRPHHPGQRRREDLRHDGLATRMDDRPRRRDQGGRQPAVAPELATCRTSRSARRSPPSPGPQDAVATMRDAFDRRRRLIQSGLDAIDGIVCPLPAGAFYVYPDVTGLLGREWAGSTPTTSLELADLILETGRGRGRARRGVRSERIPALQLRARRRRHRRGRQPPAEALRLSVHPDG